MSATAISSVRVPTPSRVVTSARAVSILLGFVLLTAAGLKLSGLNVTPLPRVGWFAVPRVQLAAAEWELVLGLWLVSGIHRTGAWLASFGTFSVFAVVSGYLGWTGIASCGCFGAIKASPWTAFSVDLAALLLLALVRPRSVFRSIQIPAGATAVFAGSAVLLIALTGIGSIVYGSPRAAIARLRGELVTLSSDYVNLGSGAPGDVLETTVEVWNWSDRPVRLIGSKADCVCVSTSELPIDVPSGSSREMRFVIRIPETYTGGNFTRLTEIWT